MSNLSNRNIVLNRNDIQQCIAFAREFASNKAEKSSNDFGATTLPIRDLTDKTADTITGKLAEVAFLQYCKNNQIEIEIDFDISEGRLNIDNGQDIVQFQGKENNIKCDIKGAKHFAQWLMVESHKLDQNIIIADIYILVKLNLPNGVEQNLELFDRNKIEAEIAGFAFKEDFFDVDMVPWFHYRAGASPLKRNFVQKIVNHSYQSLDEKSALKKTNLIESYIEIAKSVKNNEIFLSMVQKAPHNFGLPVDYLRKSDSEFIRLFELLSDQKKPGPLEPIFNNT